MYVQKNCTHVILSYKKVRIKNWNYTNPNNTSMKIDDDRRRSSKNKNGYVKMGKLSNSVLFFSLDFLQNSNYFHKSDINYLQLFIFSIF